MVLGTYDKYDDFLITRIRKNTQTPAKSWDLLVNCNFAEMGGCQIQPGEESHDLWVYGAYIARNFLDIVSDPNFHHSPKVAVGEPITNFVRNLKTGKLVEGANLLARTALSDVKERVSYQAGKTTRENGTVKVVFHKHGNFYVKANRDNGLRSIGVAVSVAPK